MREAEVRKEIALYGLTWEAFEAFMVGRKTMSDRMGKGYFTHHIKAFIDANKPKEMKHHIIQYDYEKDALNARHRSVALFEKNNYTVLFYDTFFDSIAGKHTSIIFYYE